jgi:ubiquinone/menaquinone biosynthesis C-methylase UbiE
MNWNRLRYTFWAPWYDTLVAAVDFGPARRESIRRLNLARGQRVLLSGAGTGLDLDYLPPGVAITAIDVTGAMLTRLRHRAAGLGLSVHAHIMDAGRLGFADAQFDAVVLHLILAVMPDPARGLREAARVLAPGGRVAVFDKFLASGTRPSLARRAGNLVIKPLFSDLTLQLEPLLAPAGLSIVEDTPAGFGGMYRAVTLARTDGPHAG